MDQKSEAFALSGFMLTANLMRLLAFKGVITRAEAMATVDEARRQLSALGTTNRAARADMLDRELLDYEALFQEVDERAAQELMDTLADTLSRILDQDADGNLDIDGDPDPFVEPGGDANPGSGRGKNPGAWTRDDWNGEEWGRTKTASEAAMSPNDAKVAEAAETPAIEIADYEDNDEEPANQR